jgi:DNA-binding NarL/FixJ family response regulator
VSDSEGGLSQARDIVLVVDDSPPTLGVLNQALEAAGYTVLVAQDGAAALALVERVTPDIVLMDAVMPGLDGFETCRRMKLIPSLAAVPIVFMTGLTETEHVIRGLEAGGVDYVTKPVAPDEVIARLQVHLANARLTRSAQVALDAAGRFLLAVDRAGRVLWSTPQATRLLEEAGAPGAVLPSAVAAWIQRSTTNAGAFPPTSMTAPFGANGERRLEVSYVGQVAPNELLLRLVAGQGAAGTPSEAGLLREALKLTVREAEVLLWISRGKSNRDIAEILGLSHRTVSKHLEQIFEKLGVENRTAATALAIRHLQGQHPQR